MAYTDKWLTRVILNPNEEGNTLREGHVYELGELVPVAEGEYFVDVDVKLTSREIKELRASRSRVGGEETAFLNTFILGQVHDWNLDGPDGVLPITKDTVAGLDRDDAAKIVSVISAGRRNQRTPAEETDFS